MIYQFQDSSSLSDCNTVRMFRSVLEKSLKKTVFRLWLYPSAIVISFIKSFLEGGLVLVWLNPTVIWSQPWMSGIFHLRSFTWTALWFIAIRNRTIFGYTEKITAQWRGVIFEESTLRTKDGQISTTFKLISIEGWWHKNKWRQTFVFLIANSTSFFFLQL